MNQNASPTSPFPNPPFPISSGAFPDQPDHKSEGGGQRTLAARQPAGKEILRARALQLRHAADQLDRLAGMLPGELTPEQDYALNYFLQSTNVSV
jgi:hypothetical protein